MITLDIDLVSDIVCPWCAIGLARLQQATDRLDDIECRLHWHPFVLNPDIGPEGRDMVAHLAAKYGKTPDEVRESQQQIIAAAAESGLDFKRAAERRSWNTFDVHRVLHEAREAGVDQAFNEQLFDVYFREAADPTDPALLREIGMALGMDASHIDEILAGERHADAVRAEIDYYQQLGVTAVPSFVVAERYLISGAQPPEVLADALRQIAAELTDEAGSPA
ncbi:DsbA family oxidoreductase [Salinisphaera sp. RV14]|uniref:DsbA family oxidoreductase n=1 Tax=unclassified Salinisphaera TaxID=2649847 RepID=UPI003F86415B